MFSLGARIHPTRYIFHHTTPNGRPEAIGANQDVALDNRTIGESKGDWRTGRGSRRVRRHPLGEMCVAILPQFVDERLNDGRTGKAKESAFDIERMSSKSLENMR